MGVKVIKKVQHIFFNSVIWHTFIVVLIAYTAVELPFLYLFDVKLGENHLWIDNFISAMFFIDVVYNFRKSRKDKDQIVNEFGFNLGKQRPYHRSWWLPMDILTAMPLDLIQLILGGSSYFKMIRLVRIARLFKILQAYQKTKNATSAPKLFKIVLITTSSIIAIHFIACGWIYFNPESDLDFLTQYNLALYWTVTTLTTIGYGDITPANNVARLYTMIIQVMGAATYGYIIANVSSLLVMADQDKKEKIEKMKSLTMLMKDNFVPINLQKQVFSFYSHLMNKKVSDAQTQILSELPLALKQELEVFMKIKLIQELSVFQGLKSSCLLMIANMLQEEVYSPKQAVINNGDIGDEMYIIAHGEVEVSIGGKRVASLHEGQFFGEVALLESVTRTADVVTKDYCDLLVLSKSDFLLVCEKYPELYQKFTSTQGTNLRAA
jgi:voltage-gated potassium channel